MKSITLLTTLLLFLGTFNLNAQTEKSPSEIEQITSTLMDYIEGTSNGEPDRLRRAFHPDFNLYAVTKEDSLQTRSGEKYISYFKPGKKNSRIGRIISIDYENNAGVAKVEILMPPSKKIYTDYFLLLKYEGSWKIVHKSYTSRLAPGAEDDK